MGNAVRLFVFCLTLTAVGATAVLTQLWVRNRAHARQHTPLADTAAYPTRSDLNAYHADQQKALLLVVAVSFGSLILMAVASGSRWGSFHDTTARIRSREDMHQVEHLAKTAVAHEEALRHERAERQRTDENLHIQQLLLNQALGEKIRLGRDLHDGVIQSLYATGLTLESSRQRRAADPAAADALFERGVQLLNDNIREIRAYISSLSQSQPSARHDFSNALAVLVENLKGDRTTEFVIRIDEGAEVRLSPTQLPDLLQIVHEAVSNALRHGNASQVTIRLHEDGDRLALMVQDNGAGFDPSTVSSEGHGLVNFRARASSLHSEFRLESQPGEGCRLVLTFPALPSV
ncbi:MAG: ATP-binding protein [Opitutaceae bacterium]